MSLRKELERYSLEELEALAIDLHARYGEAARGLEIHLCPPTKAELDSLDGMPALDDVLTERKWRLNRAFRFTPETLARFVKISDLFMACMEKAWREAKPERDALERRLRDGDPFLKDYEIDWKIEPYTNKEGIYEVLEDVVHRSSALLDRSVNAYEEHTREMDCDGSWTECHRGHEELATQRIGYAMHELYDHSCWSVPDILKIEKVWVDVVIRRQYFEEDL